MGGSKTVDVEVVRRGFGRPTKLDADLIEKAREYVERTSEFSYQMLPTIEGLSLAMLVDRTTIYQWEKDDADEDFSNIVRQLRSAQAEKLIQMSLNGRYNPMISKLMLSKHGYVEKSETDSRVEVVQPILGAQVKQVEDVHSDQDDL